MPMFAMYRPQVEYSILFVKIVNRYVEREQFFFLFRQFRSFDHRSVRIKDEKTLYLSVWENFLFTLLWQNLMSASG